MVQMEIEQKKLDLDHQRFLSEKEAQVVSEKEQVTAKHPRGLIDGCGCSEKAHREGEEGSRSKGRSRSRRRAYQRMAR